MKTQVIGILAIFVLALAACNSKPKADKAVEAEKLETAKGLHEADRHGEGEGEEDGTMLAIDEVYDLVKKGTHLVLKYDQEARAFLGTVENVSDEMLSRVRVEIHLSNGKELGPTVAADLEPGEKREVELAVGDEVFETWSTHAEVGDNEHGHGGEGEHSHDEEGEGEHGHSHEDGGHEHN
ncbi:MAG: FxLYD domain-containing protein [Bacteroidota bacterium]|nr:FxLYD domain-containing protein [Bacteroidota bacterium]